MGGAQSTRREFPRTGVQSRSTFESDEKQQQIDNEQQHNGRFEDQHQAIGLVVLQQLVKIVQRLQFFIDRPVPIAQMKAGGDVLVNSRQMPITEEFGDVGEFIAEAGGFGVRRLGGGWGNRLFNGCTRLGIERLDIRRLGFYLLVVLREGDGGQVHAAAGRRDDDRVSRVELVELLDAGHGRNLFILDAGRFSGDRLHVRNAAHPIRSKNFLLFGHRLIETLERCFVNGKVLLNFAEAAGAGFGCPRTGEKRRRPGLIQARFLDCNGA